MRNFLVILLSFLPSSCPFFSLPPPSCMSLSPHVPYYWDNFLQKCEPCTRCEDTDRGTWSPCTLFLDTNCGMENTLEKWREDVEQLTHKNTDDDMDSRQLILNNIDRDENANYVDIVEGQLVYETQEQPNQRKEKTFGKKKWREEVTKKNTLNNFLPSIDLKRNIMKLGRVDSEFGVQSFFAEEEEGSANGVLPGKHDKEAFNFIMELMEGVNYADIYKEDEKDVGDSTPNRKSKGKGDTVQKTKTITEEIENKTKKIGTSSDTSDILISVNRDKIMEFEENQAETIKRNGSEVNEKEKAKDNLMKVDRSGTFYQLFMIFVPLFSLLVMCIFIRKKHIKAKNILRGHISSYQSCASPSSYTSKGQMV